MNHFLGKRVGYFLLLLIFTPASFAGIILAELEQIDDTSWLANYSLSNTLSTKFDQFTIYFQQGYYENLSLVSAPSDWDPLIIQPDPALPGDGFFDALSLGLPLQPGESFGGFSVSFDWLGLDGPGQQWFQLIDSFSFEVLYTGFTQVQGVVTPVNEPSSLMLFIVALFSLYLIRRKAHQPEAKFLAA